MEILFINPSLRPDSLRRQLPVGIAYVMTAVKKAGFDFDFIDMDVDNMSMNDLTIELEKKTYDVVAFGCIVTGFRYVKEISAIVKDIDPNTTIIAGNSVATSIPEILMNNTLVDIAVLGEADITIVELLKAIEKRESYNGVSGIAFQESGKIRYTGKREVIPDIDTIGFPEWDLFDLKKYNEYGHVNANVFSIKNALFYPLNSARGCPFNCTFCYHVFKDDKYRKYSGDCIIEEIKRLYHSYDATFISFWDELTFSNVKDAKIISDKISELDFKVAWAGTARANLFKTKDIELIKEMRASGCDNIAYSLENASPEILLAINKKIKVSDFVEQSKALWKGGVTPLTSVIFGYPQETPESIQLTLDVCEECNIFPSVGFLLPLPGTPIYQWACENGFIGDEVKYLERVGDRQDFHINLTQMDDEKFVETVTVGLESLARKQGLKFESVFKTVTYQRPKNLKYENINQ
jgi:anaerobic magnesium-protoporphyrin IX monomethyl ester cyclase